MSTETTNSLTEVNRLNIMIGLTEALVAASSAEMYPMPPQIEPTEHNKTLWSLAHATGLLQGCIAIKKVRSKYERGSE